MADEPVAACTRILALNPNDAFAYNNRGLAYFRNGDYDRAIADADQAIELNPKYAAAMPHVAKPTKPTTTLTMQSLTSTRR